MTSIPLRPVAAAPPHAGHYDAPYQAFIAASLALGLGGGFLLSLLLPLARTLDWSWGEDVRWSEMAQIHGQFQLIGFGGLFVMGMALRVMPRVSGRRLAWQPAIPFLIPLIASYLVLRGAGQPMHDGAARDIILIVSAILLIAAALLFAAIVWSTLLHSESRAEATGYFFALGAAGMVASSLINGVQTYHMVRDSLAVAPATRQTALVFTQQFGFLIMFIAGVGSRAIPGLTGRPRGQIAPRVVAIAYGGGVAGFSAFLLYAAERRPAIAMIRLGDAALLTTGLCLLALAWISGALLPGSNVARASRVQFWFVRVAFVWVAVAGGLIIWHAGHGMNDGAIPDQFALDAIRHTLTVGVLTTMIVGMSLLIVPEFAGRRLQHPREAAVHVALLAAITASSALRIWPPIEGVDWLEDSRHWPIAISAVLSAAAVIAFAAMFAQSWLEQRDPAWSARAAGLDAP